MRIADQSRATFFEVLSRELQARLVWMIAMGAIIGWCGVGQAQAQIQGTQHDFSGFSWTGVQGCVVCHATHPVPGKSPWNHTFSSQVYTLYSSPSFDAKDLGQPTELSKVCLSCHDGTVAVDDFGGTKSDPPSYFLTGKLAFGSDLSKHHPVSFTFDSDLAAIDGSLRDPSVTDSGLGGTIAAKMLRSGKVECATCHDPHDNSKGRFLVKPIFGRGAALCNTCHFDSGPTTHHIPRRDDPWGAGQCVICHGAELQGEGNAPACTTCHKSFSAPNPPATGHHRGDRTQPFASHCTDCHATDLKGGIGPSCYTCHGKIWTGDPSQATPPQNHDQLKGGTAWHKPGYEDPLNNGCTLCHGASLNDGFAPACNHCHGPQWDGHDFDGKPWLDPNDLACLPCHDGRDWNHARTPTTGYTVTNTTLAQVGDPNGVSSKCMDCHEGNLGVDDFVGTLSNGKSAFVSGPRKFGTDLAKHHPVSFRYDAELALAHGGLYDPTTRLSGISGGTIEQDMLEDSELQCTACHNQHFSPNRHMLVKEIRAGLCFTCHIRRLPNESVGWHHIPRRNAPWGEAFSCTECHGNDLLGLGGAPACVNCHNAFNAPDPPPHGHHGGDRFNPSTNCADCHREDLHGGIEFSGLSPPSCYRCHGNLWAGVPVVNPGGPYEGLAGEIVHFDASATRDDGGVENLSFEWTFGDGSEPVRPRNGVATATHTYADPGTYEARLVVTDGESRPVARSFTVVINDPNPSDRWRITVASPPETFTLTIDKQGTPGDETFEGIKNDGTNTTYVLGVEIGSVIFWMDAWSDASSNVLVGGISVYFGNIDRAQGTMRGLVFPPTANITTFEGVVDGVSDR